MRVAPRELTRRNHEDLPYAADDVVLLDPTESNEFQIGTERRVVARALVFAFASTGSSIPARIAIVTSCSIKVKPSRKQRRTVAFRPRIRQCRIVREIREIEKSTMPAVAWVGTMELSGGAREPCQPRHA